MGLSEKDIKEIKNTYDKMVRCMEALDWDGLAEMCTDDMIHVTADADLFKAHGKQSLHDRFVETMGDFKSLEIEYDIETISGDGNCAYVLSPNKDIIRFSDSDEPLVLEKCQTLSALEKQPDHSWKCKLQMCAAA